MFVEEKIKGLIRGNEVVATPVPYRVLVELANAQKSGDDELILEKMCAVVAGYVTTADGALIDTDALSQGALVDLFNFAVNAGKEPALADFTSKP